MSADSRALSIVGRCVFGDVRQEDDDKPPDWIGLENKFHTAHAKYEAPHVVTCNTAKPSLTYNKNNKKVF